MFYCEPCRIERPTASTDDGPLELLVWQCMFCGKCHVAPPEVTCDCTPPPSFSLGGLDSIISAASPPSTHASDGSLESTESAAENQS
jgi:hypothetical protein